MICGIAMPVGLLAFGDSVNAFINRASTLCSYNLTLFAEQYCPPNTILTTLNFYTIIQ